MGPRPIPSSPHLYTLASDREASSGKIGGKTGLFKSRTQRVEGGLELCQSIAQHLAGVEGERRERKGAQGRKSRYCLCPKSW